MALQSIVLPLVSVFRSAGFNEAMKAIKGLDGSFKDVAKSAGLAAASFAAGAVLQNVTQYIDEAVVVTQKYERNILALNQVFQSQSAQMRQFTKDAQAIGVSQGQAAQASVFLGSVLKQYGLDAGRTAEETKKLVGLSQDLATTYGYDLQEALLAMTALFRGEYDPIEKFGVAMKQNEVNALVAARGQSKLTGQMLFQAQVQARLDLLYQRSADSMGAFERAQGTLYVAQQQLNASLENQQIAFGEPLQGPLATITDLFAQLIERTTPLAVGMGEALGAVLEFTGETAAAIAELAFSTIDYLAQAGNAVVEFANTVNDATNGPDRPAPEDTRTRQIRELEERIVSLQAKVTEGALGWQQYEKEILKAEQAIGVLKYAYGEDTELKRFQLQADRTKTTIDDSTVSVDTFSIAMKQMGLEAYDADGKLIGLAGIFDEIANNAKKSRASDELALIGFNASQIEYFLTKPDWEQIFGEISRLAKIAAIDISTINPFGTEYWDVQAAKNRLKALMDEVYGKTATTSGTSTVKKSVKTIFDVLKEETQKQTARLKLENLGASEGLINMILGRDDWMSLWIQIKQGVVSLEDLQKQFNKTADGAKELEAASQAAADALAAEQQAAADAWAAQMQALQDQKDAIKAIGEELKKTAILDMLPSVAELGKYEQSVVDQFNNIKASIVDAFNNKAITQEGYKALTDYANLEQATLQSIARQRDDLAKRYDLASALIEDYRKAFSTSMNLVSMLNQIEQKTQKVTMTEVSTGMVTLSDSLKEFQVTLTKTYDETIATATDPAQAVLDGFRTMAQKARDFAANLKKLDEMGLDPTLFKQLLDAGVEAGGATAQALVDGGNDVVTEVSSLFREIDSLGASYGEQVATTMYGQGVDISNGLLEGLKSLAADFEQTGIDLADAFTSKFTEMVNQAVADAIAALGTVKLPETLSTGVTYDYTGMPQVTVGAAANAPQMPTAVVVTPSPGATTPTTTTTNNIYASSFFGGYQAAQGLTASQSRIATNNGGISAFVNI